MIYALDSSHPVFQIITSNNTYKRSGCNTFVSDREIQTDRQIDRQTDRQTDRLTDRQTDRQTDTHRKVVRHNRDVDRHTYRKTDTTQM